jgi:hypothetical protein
MFPTKKSPKISAKFFCEKCNYYCSKQSEYNKHIFTNKHKILQNPTFDEKLYSCKCGKIYKHLSTLYAHKKKCINESIINTEVEKEIQILNEPTDKEIIMMLIKENAEVKNMIMEQQNMIMKVLENGTYNINTNTNNSHNKTFNLQFFLNETCKNAMNMTDFVDSIKLQLSDLENVGKLGYVEGISNIITSNLKALDVTERPIHCTDKKREVLYVKDEDKWEKEDEEKKKIKKVIKTVANKNIRLLQKFKEVHPDCGKSTSKFSDQYDKIIVEAMGGSGDNDLEKEEKIIQRISKNVTIDKF